MTDQLAPANRAGRNLPAAIGVGLTLGALVIGTLFTRHAYFMVVVVAAISIGTWEMSRALRTAGYRIAELPVVLGGAVMLVAAYQRGPSALLFGLVVTVLACLAWLLPDGGSAVVRDLAASVFVAAYVPFLAGFAAMLVAPPDGHRRIVAFIATCVCSDTGGYIAGVLKGRHPMAPTVSPKKSWEGFAGSVTACLVGGTIFLAAYWDLALWKGAVFGLAVVCAATLGDLGESLIKRDLGIKDMGHILPGHGGLMDRLDSLLMTAPVCWLLLSAFVPTT